MALALYYSRRSKVWLLSAIAFFTVAVVLILRHLTYAEVPVETAMNAGRVQWSVMFFFGGLMPTLVAESVGAKPSRIRTAMLPWSLISASLVWLDGLITSPIPVSYPELTGAVAVVPQTGPYMWLFLVPLAVAGVADQVRVGLQAEGLRGHTRLLVAITLGIAFAAINDICHASGVFTSLGLLDIAIGFGGVAIVGAFGSSLGGAFARLEHSIERQDFAIAKSTEGLRTFIENVPEVLFFVRDGLFIPSNRAARSLFGHDPLPPESLGRDVRDVERLRSVVETRNQTPRTLSVGVMTKDGAERVECTVVSMTLEDEQRIVASVRRIGEREELERRLRMSDRLSSLGTMAAGVAHEINNPLAYITANLEYSIDNLCGNLPADQVEPLREALDGSRRVADIVSQLQRFAAQPTGSEDLSTQVEDAMQIALRIARARIKHAARIEVDIFPDLPDVELSEGQLSQVILNLVTNALDAMPPDRTSQANVVSIRADRVESGVCVSVEDNGSGMDEHTRDHLFDPFFTTKSTGDGMGLGMSITHSIVTLAGGTIEVESELGRGSTFRLFLPVAANALIEESEQSDATLVARSVLLVDDDRLVLRAMERLIGRNHRVATARGVADAKQLMELQSFDVVVCDVMMPGLTGTDLYNWVVENHPSMRDRFLFLTGGLTSHEIERRVASLGVPLLAKPLSAHEFEQAVTRLYPPPG